MRFEELLKQPGNVIIMRKKAAMVDSLQYLLDDNFEMEEKGKWRVYY